jgi:phage-related protein
VADYQLWRIQIGLAPDDWKAMRSVAPGVRELRIRIDGQYRVLYWVRRAEGVIVLHAFRKKTAKTPHLDVELARRRLKSYLTSR